VSLCLSVLLGSSLKVYLWVSFVSFTVTYAAEVAEVQQDVLFMICGLGVLSEIVLESPVS